jgi:hypothetical protein
VTLFIFHLNLNKIKINKQKKADEVNTFMFSLWHTTSLLHRFTVENFTGSLSANRPLRVSCELLPVCEIPSPSSDLG